MKIKSTIAAGLLMASGLVAAQAFAQSAPPDKAAVARQKLKAQREAAIAAAKARQNTINRPVPTATPTATPTVAPTATPTVTPTVTPTTRPTPTTTPTATPTTTPTAAPTTTPTATANPSASAAATPAPSGSAVPKPAPVALALALNLEELKKSRPERRKVEVQQLQARWGGELLRNERATSELKLHAQRTAYLQRIRALASKANDAKTVQAVDVLITKEDTRNADAMNALRSGALPAPIAGGAK